MSNPLILGTNSIKDTGYEVANSLRFNEGSSDDLTRTPSSAGNRRTWTYSAWHKVEAYNNDKAGRFLVAQTDGSNLVDFAYGSNGEIYLGIYEGGAWKETVTNAKHRDVSAWYHLVVAVDTTQATDSNRVKLYVNGVHQTSLSTSNYPSQNYETSINNTVSHIIGRYTSGIYFNGYMAEVVLIDGQALDPTSFGEFDSDTNIWKPIDVSGLTFGTNGFYLDFENSSSLGADVSGNGNNFTVNNLTSIDQTTDTPTNNYATMNPLGVTGATSFANFSNGNLTYTGNSSTYGYVASTIGVSSGKWYFEAKLTQKPNTNTDIGIADLPSRTNTQMLGVTDPNSISYRGNGSVYQNNSALSWTGGTYVLNDIVGIALDLDNNRLFFSINGTWQNSADPTTSTGAISITAPENLGTTGAYFFAVGDQIGYDTAIWECNFGNPTITISSGNSDANGYGNFEYSVPSGYYALNTKNLAEYG